MQDPKKIIGNSLLSSISDLSDSYDILSVLSEGERKSFIQNFVEISEKISCNIKSKRTNAAIETLLKFQYLVRYKYGIDAPDYYFEHYFEHICRSKADKDIKLDTFKRFKISIPNETEYIALVTSVIESCDFYDLVGFLTNNSGYPAPLPDSDISFEEWLDSNHISKADDSRKYITELDEVNSKLFFRKSRINEIKNKWNELNIRHDSFRKEIIDLFPLLYSSKKWLKDLKLAELENEIKLQVFSNANEAIEQGITRKHLLVEKGLSAIDSYKNITRGM